MTLVKGGLTMTLRELMESLDVTKSCPSNFEKNDVSNPDDFSSSELVEYFNSSKFQNDIFHCMEDVKIAAKFGYDFNDFYLYLLKEVDGKIVICVDILKF